MRLFFDIDTQMDFVFPAGALYASGSERVIAPVARLNRFAAVNGIPVISTMCAHPEDAREFTEWPPHCVAGTFGQHKLAATLLEKRIVIPNARTDFDIAGAQQVIIEKDDLDLFTNPNVPALLDRIGAEEFYVYGVFAEYCVKCAVMGLLNRGGRVFLIEDATAAVDEEKGRAAVDQFRESGGKVLTTEDVMKRCG